MIELQSIFLRYNAHYLFRDLSFVLPAGGNLLIKGDSGAGKTSILRLILGLTQPERGSVVVDGRILDKDNVWMLRGMMAYVSQDMSLGQGRVEAFIKEVFGFKRNRTLCYDRSEAKKLLQHFGLGDVTLGSRLEDLSGGELQRVAIITALMLKRPIYLLDEITSALDHRMKKKVAEYFANLKETTLIVASHDSVWHHQDFQTLELENNGSSS